MSSQTNSTMRPPFLMADQHQTTTNHQEERLERYPTTATSVRCSLADFNQHLYEQMCTGEQEYTPAFVHAKPSYQVSSSSNLVDILRQDCLVRQQQQQQQQQQPPPPPLPPQQCHKILTTSQDVDHWTNQYYSPSSPASFYQNKTPVNLTKIQAIKSGCPINTCLNGAKNLVEKSCTPLKCVAFLVLTLGLVLVLRSITQQQQQQQAQIHYIDQQVEQTSAHQDVLKSKLLIGEFVVSSQNDTHSAAQKLFLAENLVKLIDQVFLSAQVRNVYSRTEVTSIRPNRSGGIIVDCNIILTDSIGYAAQMFGFALYDSLAKSNERLAGQPSFIVDKNSIRFNTVPDKDIQAGLYPSSSLISSSERSEVFSKEEEILSSVLESQQAANEQIETIEQVHRDQDQESPVVWSAWSQWSSCVDKNGLCDPGRLHSRLRKCVAQKSGEQVDAAKCRQRFSLQDQELQVSDCAQQCSESLMSDAPQMGPTSGQAGPQTAPSAVLGGEQAQALAASSGRLFNLQRVSSTEPAIIAVASSPTSTTPSSNNLLEQPARSCSNCTSDEICLLIEQQKVPFCAKIRDQSDECGGWCERGQLCQPLSEQQHHHLDRSLAANTTPSSVASRQGAFKCVHDSECLADEWRCQDSACIPLAKRCDGHSNCYDNSDERDCSAQVLVTRVLGDGSSSLVFDASN